jgi:hypothetical protein
VTDIGEMVNVAISARHTKQGCYFCNRTEGSDANDLEEEEEEDSGSDVEAGNDQKNNSGKLGQSLTGGSPPPVYQIRMNNADKNLRPGAHHLIPGYASLKQSAVKKLLGTDSGSSTKNVGYNVNDKANGEWLAANYAVRPWSSKKEKFKKVYAYLAMRHMTAQFHDAHPTYSDTVLQALNNCAKKAEFLKKVACPECGEGKGTDDPPYAIVSRLNAMSGWLRQKVTGDPLQWRVKTLFTSQWAVRYHDLLKKHGKRKVGQLLEKAESETVNV